MKVSHRRQFLRLAAGAAALAAVPRTARAQAYPSRPVRVVVGFPAGGTNDIHARLIAEWLSKQFGSGRTEARTGLRMMPTSPRSPPIIPYGGFSPVRLEGWPFRRGLPNTSA